MKLNILYEDNHIIVVEKPVNVLSQSDITGDEDMLTLIKKYIKEKYNKPGNVYLGLVHRLDRPVGGIMVFAKTSKAAARLSDEIKNNKMHKKYYAIVHGHLNKNKDILKDKIEKIDKKTFLNTPNGKEAILEYKVLNEKDNLSLVDVNLITGRYHQIRLQFSSRNHPIYADKLYGYSEDKGNILLFAYHLEFIHPVTKELLNFEIKPQKGLWGNFF